MTYTITAKTHSQSFVKLYLRREEDSFLLATKKVAKPAVTPADVAQALDKGLVDEQSGLAWAEVLNRVDDKDYFRGLLEDAIAEAKAAEEASITERAIFDALEAIDTTTASDEALYTLFASQGWTCPRW